MVTTILTPKVQASGFVDLVLIGGAKQIEERLTSPIIGNGTLVSGLIKGIIGAIIDGKGGRIGKVFGGAFAVDAGEDIAMALMGMIGLNGGGGVGGLPGLGGLTGAGGAGSRDMTNALNW